MVVGVSLPDQSAMRRGTSISRPSTFTMIFSIAAGAGFVSVVAAVDIEISEARRPIVLVPLAE